MEKIYTTEQEYSNSLFILRIHIAEERTGESLVGASTDE